MVLLYYKTIKSQGECDEFREFYSKNKDQPDRVGLYEKGRIMRGGGHQVKSKYLAISSANR